MTAMLSEWAVSASALILVVLALRGLLGKCIGAGLRYGLWAVVLVRLLIPASFISLAVTVPQLPKWTPPEAMREESIYLLPVQSQPVEESDIAVGEGGALTDPNSFGYSRLEDDGKTITRYAERISPLELLGWVWLAGTLAMGTALLASNLRFWLRLRRVRWPLEGLNTPVPVFAAPGLPSPCLAGVFRPAVYVTEETAESPSMLRHVLAHELTHYNHRDHLWSVLRGIALAAHWWNPLVWLAVVCSRRDGELACDAGAIKRLGDGERAAYGETLLTLVTAKASPVDLLHFATTMTGGKRSLTERIRRIACQPKQLVSAMIAVVSVLTLSLLAAFAQAKEPAPPEIFREPPSAAVNRPDDAWMNAKITLSEDRTPHTVYQYGNTMELLAGEPVPVPRAWAGRKDAAALSGSPEVWAKLVSPKDGWLVVCYSQDTTQADTYVYKTEDGGMTWTETAMPETNWRISDVGFLSADRLILSQQMVTGAPCRITKDGGERWEEINLPDRMAAGIRFDGEVLTLYVAPSETEAPTYTMASTDLGDTWLTEKLNLSQGIEADLNHDGIPDTLRWRRFGDGPLETHVLQFYAGGNAYPSWEAEAYAAHVGWMALLLCSVDGEDYLLKYMPWMGGGVCDYQYKLFYFTPEGGEVVVQENSLRFDLIFSPDYAESHQFDPEAIAAFMDEVNALLANSTLLINTDQNLAATFAQEGRLYDSLWWLDNWDENLSLFGNLENFAQYAQDHPDGTWSALEDVLQSLTEGDVTGSPDGDNATLVHCLRSGERGSRFYTWDSFEAAYYGHFDREEEVSWYKLNLLLADGSMLHVFTKDYTEPPALLILETWDETVSAYYDMPELQEYVESIIDRQN